MPIKRAPVAVFMEYLYCDECGAEMETTGFALLSKPPQYPHGCPKCGAEQTHPHAYPRTVTERIENAEKG